MKEIGLVFTIVGGLFMALGGLGVLRMPDTLNRIQAGTKATTLGLFGIMIGVAFYYPSWILKVVAIIVFVAISNPVGSSVLGRAIYLRHKDDLILVTDEFEEGGKENV